MGPGARRAVRPAACKGRGCNNYDPSQMWFYSPYDQMIRQATYTRSIQHRDSGKRLSQKSSTWQHHCLAHVLGIGEAWHVTEESQWPITGAGTIAGQTEVWGGPLQGGRYVLALVNRNDSAANITARYAMLEVPTVGDATVFTVESLWDNKSLGVQQGGFRGEVPGYDMSIFILSPVPETLL